VSKSLDALGTGAVDLPERQRTLRATMEWSVGLLDDAERSLLEIMAIFTGGWTVESAAEIAGLEEDRALDLTEALARHSLVQLDRAEHGPRLRMLETIREFVAERLGARPGVTEVARRQSSGWSWPLCHTCRWDFASPSGVSSCRAGGGGGLWWCRVRFS
jgi:predicted ATPase